MDETDVLSSARRARSVALMHGAGAVLCTMSLLAPGSVPGGLPRTAFLVTLVVCSAMCAVAVVRGPRLGTAAVVVALLLGDAVIAMVTLLANEREGGNSDLLLLLWPTLSAAIFLSRRLIAVQLAGGLLVGVVVYHEAEAGIGVALIQLLVLVVSLSIAALVVVQLRERLTEALRVTDLLSRTDPLTALANRRGLEEQLTPMWAWAARREQSLAVLLLDVDHFKDVNDVHGHPVGDRVLVELGCVVRALLRTEDVVARFGGEELVIVAADADGCVAVIGERLRHGVEQAALPVPVTVSVGSVAHVPQRGEDPAEAFTALLEQADLAMYEAKRAGRNRVVHLEGVARR